MLQCFHVRYDSNIHANNCYENYKKVLAKLDKYLEDSNEDNIPGPNETKQQKELIENKGEITK